MKIAVVPAKARTQMLGRFANRPYEVTAEEKPRPASF